MALKKNLYLCRAIRNGIVLKRPTYIVIIIGVLLCSSVAGGRTRGRIPPSTTLYGNQLDTLTFGERISLKTNVVDWITLVPNLGVEFTLGQMNWNRWTFGLSGRLKPTTSSPELPYYVYDINDIRLSVRRYRHGTHPRRSFFLECYAAYGKHDVKLGWTGYRGKHAALGLAAGLIMPVYRYRNNSSIDLELSLGIGAVFANDEEYENDGDVYRITSQTDNLQLTWNPLLLLACNDALRISIVYHFGPSVANRYKRRIEIDERYRLHVGEMKIRHDSIQQARQERKAEVRDSLDKVAYERRFEKQRLELERKFINDSIRQAKRQIVNDSISRKKK